MSAVFSSDADSLPDVEANPGPTAFFDIQPFSLAEVRGAMLKMRCGRGADGDGLVLELFKHGPPCLHACLVRIYNDILCTGSFDSSWRHTLFTMVPKSWDLQQTRNWRPIATVKITYIFFAQMLHDRLQPLLERELSMDQVGFRRGTGIDHALAVFETVCGKSVEWNAEIWFANLDLTKAFDRVEHDQLFQALKEQHVPQPYIALLRAIYSSQTGSVFGGRPFAIQRGVKQGDILSPMLFNAALECALRKWKGKCGHHGIAMDHHERLTNIRYADDLMLYARSLPALVEMIETLSCELQQVGLQLNAAKSKIFTTKPLDHPMYAEVSQDLVHVLHGEVSHKYLGRHIPGNLKQRGRVELHHRVTSAWAKFNKHRTLLTNKHVSLQLRLKFFNAVVTPVMLFSLHTLALTKIQLESINVLQRKMLRSIVGWVRMSGEDWSETMRRMNHRISVALEPFPIISMCCQSCSRAILGIEGWTLDHNRSVAFQF